MSTPALHKDSVAVITGGASGIGLAAACYYAKAGMHIFLADQNQQALDQAVDKVKAVPGVGQVEAMKVDVSKLDEVIALKDKVLDVFGEIGILMNNAGISLPTPAFSLTKPVQELQQSWHTILDVNFGGILNGTQVFAPVMAHQENVSVIINTGSKQGITCPPGNAGYNVSKAAVKTLTEQLAHELREIPGSNCTAHLFVPGWTHTGMTAGGSADKPAGAWSAEQTVEYMIERVFERGDFYVLVPDNDCSSKLDQLRISWALGDVIENRPALSRWHPSYKARFDEYVNSGLGLPPRSRSRGRPATVFERA